MATATIDIPKKPVESEGLTRVSPIDLMSQAIAQGISAEQLKILQEMHFKSLDREAEIEFNEALNRVQNKIPIVVPDLTNPQTNSKYASFAKLDKVVRPVYTAEGFSLSFNTADCPKADHVRVLAYLSRGKHTRTYQMDMPIVTTGIQGKAMMTLTHASAAANSYGKRYLECDIFNIPVGEDIDGNSVCVSAEMLQTFDACKSYDELDKAFREAFKEAKGNTTLQQQIIAAKDRRRGQIRSEVPGVELEWGKKRDR